MPAARTAFWAKHFSKEYKVSVITRGWSGNESQWSDFLASNHLQYPMVQKSDNLHTHYLPYTRRITRKGKFRTLLGLLGGDVQPEMDAYSQFSGYCREFLRRENVDLLLVSVPPLNLIRLAHELHSEFQVPWVCDFKDFENRVILKRKRRVRLGRFLISWFRQNHVYHWLESCSFFTSSTQSIVDHIEMKAFKRGHEVRNGYEHELFSTLTPTSQTQAFTISTLGTIYPQQDIGILAEGVRLFKERRPDARLRLRFIGTASIPRVAQHIYELFGRDMVEVTPRLEREKALRIGKSSQVLYYPGWKDYSGVYSGKLFEYLGLRRYILICPGDGDVIDRTIQRTGSGSCTDSPQEVARLLQSLYKEWETTGDVACPADGNVMEEYSRTYQTRKLDRLLDEVLRRSA